MSDESALVAVRLAGLHPELDELFLLHQECLMLGQLEPARELLAAYEQLLRLHAEHEERYFLPLYARVGVEPRYPLVLYTGQHEKMLAMVQSFQSKLALITSRGQPGPSNARAARRAVLGLFDEHARFKHLIEHHDGAERAGFMAALDAKALAPERRALIEQCLAEWWKARRDLDGVIQRAQAATDV